MSDAVQVAVAIQEKSEVKVLSVEELNRHIRQVIEGELPLVWVQGEVSNFKAHTSGHFYFSLKDSKSQISAVMFRGYNSRLKFKPTDGMEVVVRGRVTVYEPRGNYQITCEMMEPVGAGALQKAFEQLKEKLKREGLFETSRKRPMPSLPRHIAIVTSPTGAAIRDMINILSRRNKAVRVTLVPTIVQGEAAAPKIVEALTLAYRLKDIDAVIVGRGGGSIEDLWCFNDERVARTIAASPVPVISAVGHEIDFTIADFVADLRAPTPSAAAELVVKNTADLGNRVESLRRVLRISMMKHLKSEKQRWQNFSSRLVDPKRKLQDLLIRSDELLLRLNQAARSHLSTLRLELHILAGKLVRPDQAIARLRSKVEMLSLTSRSEVMATLEGARASLQKNQALLDTLSPLKVVERGYSLVTKNQVLVTNSDQVEVGDVIQIQLANGILSATVTEATKKTKKK